VPTHKEPLHHLSLSQLAEVSGKARETIRKRLAEAQVEPTREDGKTVWYYAPTALEVIFGRGEGLDPQAEKARLDAAKADMEELKLAEKRKELGSIPEIESAWAARVLGWKERIRGVPAAATVHIAGFTPNMARSLLRLIDATLTELADGTGAPGRRRRTRARPRASKTTA